MSDTNQKQYVNSLWFEEKNFDSGGSILKVNVKVDELVKFLKDNKNKDGYTKLVIAKKKTVEPGKSTHYAYLDTWVPSGQTQSKVSKPTKTKVEEPQEELI